MCGWLDNAQEVLKLKEGFKVSVQGLIAILGIFVSGSKFHIRIGWTNWRD